MAVFCARVFCVCAIVCCLVVFACVGVCGLCLRVLFASYCAMLSGVVVCFVVFVYACWS